jgi:type II secretory pathway pseudopilin PulG
MRRQSGYAYLFLLYLLVILSLSGLATATLWHYERVRTDEQELLRIGNEFRNALKSYHQSGTPRVFPTSIDDLLADERGGRTMRHLRKRYFDPMTRAQEWGVVLRQGRIVAIHSLSDGQPFKVAGFSPQDSAFNGSERYSDWIFSAVALERPGAVPEPSKRTADR